MPITMTVPPLAYRKLILQDDPIIYYKLDEKSGSTFFDTTGNYDTATSSGTFTLNQSPLITNGKSVLWTNGAARSASTSTLEPTNDFSLELWVRFTGTPFAAVVTLRETSPGDIWLVMTRSRSVSGSIGAETWNFTNVSTRVESSAINDDSPHYVVATYRNSDDTLRLYIDGSFVDSAVQGGSKPTSSSPRLSLANNDGAPQPFNGYMDEVALYHLELTPEQVQKHYERGTRLSYKKVILSDNPIGYWKLDETSGTLSKDTIGTYNGTYIGNPTLNQSPLIFNGTSVYFNGTDSYVDIDPFDFDMNVGPGKQHTCEFWVKTDGNTGPVFTINLDWNFQSSQEYLVLVLPDGRLRFSTTEENIFTNNTMINDNAIHHCVIVTDENTVDFYIDGEFDSTHSVSTSSTAGNVLLICARHTDDSSTITSFTNATLDEVAVYDYPLTATQIQRHYRTGSK